MFSQVHGEENAHFVGIAIDSTVAEASCLGQH